VPRRISSVRPYEGRIPPLGRAGGYCGPITNSRTTGLDGEALPTIRPVAFHGRHRQR